MWCFLSLSNSCQVSRTTCPMTVTLPLICLFFVSSITSPAFVFSSLFFTSSFHECFKFQSHPCHCFQCSAFLKYQTLCFTDLFNGPLHLTNFVHMNIIFCYSRHVYHFQNVEKAQHDGANANPMPFSFNTTFKSYTSKFI